MQPLKSISYSDANLQRALINMTDRNKSQLNSSPLFIYYISDFPIRKVMINEKYHLF